MPITHALVVLTPSESKRLIAKAVAAMPEVRQAFEKGRLIIGNGTTNAYIAEELTDETIPKINYAAGLIRDGKLLATAAMERLAPFTFVKGKRVDTPWETVLKDFEPEDVFIKGANAVDHQGIAGVLVANKEGGTVGAILGILSARGCHLITPVGLEKLVLSVIDAAEHIGMGCQEQVHGLPCALVPLPLANVITEIQALEMSASVEVWHAASGGVAGSEGAVVLAIEGEKKEVDKAFAFVESVKGEAAVT